jgi:hypothetical protein
VKPFLVRRKQRTDQSCDRTDKEYAQQDLLHVQSQLWRDLLGMGASQGDQGVSGVVAADNFPFSALL